MIGSDSRSATDTDARSASMVTNDAALWAITSGPGGIIAGLPPDAAYVDISSVSPHTSVQIAERVTLAITVGGDASIFERVISGAA